jgi:hypothetical protein
LGFKIRFEWPVDHWFIKQFNYNITKESIITVISLVDLSKVQMLITLVEAVWILVEVLKLIQLDKLKLISLATDFARRLHF